MCLLGLSISNYENGVTRLLRAEFLLVKMFLIEGCLARNCYMMCSEGSRGGLVGLKLEYRPLKVHDMADLFSVTGH